MSPIGPRASGTFEWLPEKPSTFTTSTSGVTLYPCDKGTGQPLGYHHFVKGANGTVCTLCGKEPRA